MFRGWAAARTLATSLVDGRLPAVGIILLGMLLRLVHLAFIDLTVPFRYGGLYLEFAEQIAAHRYALPARIPFYTDGGIPFAYPPLPFYVEALLLEIGALPTFLVVNLLPPCVAALGVPSFYVLTRALGLRRPTRLAALLAYATLPVGFLEQLEGGGLAEAFGSLALIWLVVALARAHAQPTTGRYACVGVAWAICILASPASAYASAPTLGLFALAQLARDGGWRLRLRSIGLLGLSAALAVGLSAPYWLTVVANHGIGIFAASVGGQQRAPNLDWLAYLTLFQFRGDPNPVLWNVLALLGTIRAFLRRSWILIAWFVLLATIPREGAWLMALPASLLAGIGAVEVLGPLLSRPEGRPPRTIRQGLIAAPLWLLFGFSIIAVPLACLDDIVHARGDPGEQPDRRHIEAMEWVNLNTPEDSKFIVLSRDQVKEWVPQLARRTVLNMPFGAEWVPDKRDEIQTLERTTKDCPDFQCLQRGVKKTMGYDEFYVFVDHDRLAKLTAGSERRPEEQAAFRPLWENREITVGRLRGLHSADERSTGPASSYIRVSAKGGGTGNQAPTIAWSTGDGAEGRVYLAKNGGPEEPFADDSAGSKAAPRIDKGDTYTFRLYTGSERATLLASATLRGE